MIGTRQYLLLVALWALLNVSMTEELEDVVKEEVIEIENKLQKVIRVNPLELPSKQDRNGNQMNSELFQIQTLRPGGKLPRHRQYVDSKHMRPVKNGRSSTGEATQSDLKYSNTPELKAFPKQKLKTKQQKQLHFPLETRINAGETEALPIQVTPGAFPIYYVVSKTNGRFGKFPIKSFRSPAEFAKYLIKSKAEPIPRSLRFEGRGIHYEATTEGSVIRL
ncbi:uncharacterized protein LOC117785428 isoform X2 [Drosophila innubila]|uniref:uncharacterized protein LOC117785428 isoform X2 n=1 Tax=Drosophila innubila TaxID=198719 RepID=UPI00148BACE6|nr:uncharacterized protein LOC117785428 isoform X2 [Drosophila innubila]